MNRRQVLTVSVASIVGFGLGYFVKTQTTNPEATKSTVVSTEHMTSTTRLASEKITLAISINKQFYHYNLEMARRYFNRKGYDMELLFVDASRGRELFATRKSQISSVSPVATIALAESGEEVVFGPVLNITNTVIMSKKGIEEIMSSKELKIGVSILGSPDHFITSQFIKKHRLENIGWVEIGAPRNRLAALENASIDIAALNYPDAMAATRQGSNLKVIDGPYTYWVTSSCHMDWFGKNEKIVKDFIQSILFASLYCAADRTRLIQESLRFAGMEETPANVETAQKTFELYDKTMFWTSITPPDDFYRDLYEWAVSEKLLQGKADIKKLTEPVKKYINELFG